MSNGFNRHASAVAFGPRQGVLILGASGTGKSRLTLGLIDLGAQLVADDQVVLMAQGGCLYARAPRPIAGMIEARGIGLVRLLPCRLAQITLVVDLDQPRGPRLPRPETITINGVTVACLPGTAKSPFARGIAHYIARSRRVET